jgi:hypothetical protein
MPAHHPSPDACFLLPDGLDLDQQDAGTKRSLRPIG